MQTKGNRARFVPIAAVALVALAVVPMLAASASAGTVAPSASGNAARSAEWAYGGQGWNAGGLTIGKATLTWNSSAGVDVIYNATNTSANTTELTATRTVVVTVTATYTGPYTTWTYNFKVVENDQAYANITNAASVVLANGSKVPAIGILNASLHGNVTLKASLVGTAANKTVSDYLNVSGWAKANVAFTPALGIVPLNLTGVTSWTASASASGSAAWNVSWAYVNHGWNGTTASKSGDFNGTWATTTEVTLFGHVAGTSARWVDHRVRTAVGLQLTGPFDLYAGILLIPHHFDLFNGAGNAYASSGLGTGAFTTEYLFLNGGRVSTYSVTAANLTTGSSTPTTAVSAGAGAGPAVASPQAAGPGATVWAGPESPQAAQSQATCLAYGCPGSSSPLGGLLLPLAVVGLAAVMAIALILSRRGRGKAPTNATLPATPPAGPTPPSGIDPSGVVRPPP